MYNTLRARWRRLAFALLLGMITEAPLLWIVAENPPDPPINLDGAVMIASQLPGAVVSGLLLQILRISPTNTVTFSALFPVQSLFYAAAYFGLLTWLARRR